MPLPASAMLCRSGSTGTITRTSTAAAVWWALTCGATIAAAAEEFQYPLAVVATSDGTVYVADRDLPGIWKVEKGKASIHHRAARKFRTPLNAVRCLAVDDQGRLLAGDSATREVYRIDAAGKPQPLTGGAIGSPSAIAVGPDGAVYVSDLESQRVWKIAGDDAKPSEFARLAGVRGLAFDSKGRMWAVHGGRDPVVRFHPDGQREVVVPGRPFRFPHQIVINEEDAFVSDGTGRTIWKIPAEGEPEAWRSGKPFRNPVGLAIRGEDLLVADPTAQAVFVIPAEGEPQRLTIPDED